MFLSFFVVPFVDHIQEGEKVDLDDDDVKGEEDTSGDNMENDTLWRCLLLLFRLLLILLMLHVGQVLVLQPGPVRVVA